MQCICLCDYGMHLLIAGFASIDYHHGKAGLRELSFESDVSAVGGLKQNLSGKECDKAIQVAIIILCLSLTMLWVGLQCVIVAFPGHNHLHFYTVLKSDAARTTKLSLIMSIVIFMSSQREPDYKSDTE